MPRIRNFPDHEDQTRVTLALPDPHLRALDALAKRKGWTRSYAVAKLIQAGAFFEGHGGRTFLVPENRRLP